MLWYSFNALYGVNIKLYQNNIKGQRVLMKCHSCDKVASIEPCGRCRECLNTS